MDAWLPIIPATGSNVIYEVDFVRHILFNPSQLAGYPGFALSPKGHTI
jgi:hypothetical protein